MGRRRPAKICKNCLWWWDLHDTGERKCYRDKSPFYHEQRESGCTCEKFENQVKMRMNMKIGMAFCKP